MLIRTSCSAGYLVLLASVSSATQTAFWKPYQEDRHVYGLFHFDDQQLTKGQGRAASADVVGEASFEPEGKFGGALKLNGKGALKFMPSEPFTGGLVSIEAWVKLLKYPEREACIVWRPAVVDNNAAYNPAVDKSHGFALLVDSKGGLHLQVTNTFYGWTTRTSSPEGVVPANQWVHVAGISGGFRSLYVNGKVVTSIATDWGRGLMGEEKEPTPIYVGNNDKGDAGIVGLLDEVRVHRTIFKFWEREDTSWARANKDRQIPTNQAFFLEGHQPTLYLPLDGNTQPAVSRVPDLKADAGDAKYPDEGVRGQSLLGTLKLAAPKLLDLNEGSVDFWMQPVGLYNYADFCLGFLSANNAFEFYIFNPGVITGSPIPLAMYFNKEGQNHFVIDGFGTEVYEGKWYHIVLTWKDKDLKLYLDGREAGANESISLTTAGNNGICGGLTFYPSAQMDELYLYDKALTKEEVANSYCRYRDPSSLNQVRLVPVALKALYLPSHNMIYYTLAPNMPRENLAKLFLNLSEQDGKSLLRKEVPLSEKEETLKVPDLKDGKYALKVLVVDAKGQTHEGGVFAFERRHFPWERSNLGITDEVYPPFEPMKVAGKNVSVVQRMYEMNNFGLWNKVVTKGRDILAEPIRLKYLTASGEGSWEASKGDFTVRKPNVVRFAGQAFSDPVNVKTCSTIEVDGCMKVETELLPGKKPVEIRKLWVEIPLKAKEVPLFHEMVDGLRINYSGKTPEGEGVVWDGSKAARTAKWQNCFVTYLWLGAEERGLAWFGENDKGWITEKGESKTPIQEIVREGDKVVLKVYLINKPTVLSELHKLIFGLQASPTKPMPRDWRAKLADIPGGLPVTPWGGLHCAYQGPYHDDWQIVDKIVEARETKKVDENWFNDYAKRHDPPPAFGTWPWVTSVCWFANWCARVGPDKPITCYQEEMAGSVVRKEWQVFQDEWNADPFWYKHEWPDESVFRRGVNASPSGGITFGRSYQDFGTYIANEWLKRGVSLYWDNTFPHVTFNFRTTDAYLTEEGKIQPCLILWNQREYQRRVWNLLQQWRKQRKEPLEWVLHMTNTLILPVHTWGTANLDHELGSDKPFSPDWLRTETIGLQIGNYPLSLYEVFGRSNKTVTALADEKKDRIEWGMRMVHEVQHSGRLEKFVADFGYGTDQVVVHNYWSEKPVLRLDNDKVKWIVLVRPAEKSLMLVLASWSEKDEETAVRFDSTNLGFSLAGRSLADIETSEALAQEGQDTFKAGLAAPYGVRILRMSP